MSALAVSISNQWAGAFSQSLSFGTTAPQLQSTPIALTPATSVGGGTGTPTAGNWLVCIVGWNQNGLPSSTVGVGDDIHSFWRPGDESTSTWAVSTSAGNTRTSVWYTPNLALAPGNVYVAPSGVMAGMAYLVIEMSGMGSWDTVTGISTSYAAGATALTLALPAPSASSFTIGAVTGNDTGAFQSFAPGGWTALQTVLADNGVDGTCDVVLTSACITTSGSLSVAAASTTEDLSGVIIGFQVSAPSPIPAGHNPSWPLLKFEAAFGGGFQTPQDQLTWQDLSSRLWSWDETTGVQYQLGELQATQLTLELDNYDNALASDFPGSPFYSSALNSNMSFQSGTSPWTAAGTGTVITQSSAQAYASSPGAVARYSLQVTPDGVHATPGAISEKTAVSGSTVYSASAWFYSAGGYGTGAKVAITWYNSGGSVLSTVTSGALAIPAATWTQVTELNQASPSNAAFAAVTAEFSGTPPSTAFFVAEAALNLGATAVVTGLIATGVPLRIRAAIGTLGGVATNRWYVIQRNAEQWPQRINSDFRRYIEGTATDIWSTMSDPGPTPYRGEVTQDSPYAWFACDDQTLDAGVQPAVLRNSAFGNNNNLNIIVSPNGTGPSDAYSTGGYAFFTSGPVYQPPYYYKVNLGIATYTVDQIPGWLYGDPLASATSYNTSNPVTASPGSAAWQTTGQAGNTGSYGWFLSCNDTGFPPLSGGVTVEGWFQYPFFGTTQSENIAGEKIIAQQPYCALTLLTLTTNSLPVAILQLDISGHLSLITYNGSTPTSHSIYTATDLRDSTWHHYAVTLTQTAWTVYVDGGLNAAVSGSATGMTSAWTWLIANGDMGANGGGSTGNIAHSGNVYISHLAVFPSVLPLWRIIAHYCAGITGFGVIPAPANMAISVVSYDSSTAGGLVLSDGIFFVPTDGYGSSPSGASTVYSISVVAVAVAGSYTSGPSAEATTGAFPTSVAAHKGDTVYVSFTSVAPSFALYNATQAGSETQAAITNADSDAFQGGYGSSTTSYGIGNSGSGSGASPPSAPSALGDTVQQRIERCMGYGGVTYPGRCIDPSALLIQAGTDIGGQQAGTNVASIAESDGGLLTVDNLGNLTYWQRTHLASQFTTPVWAFGPDTGAGQYPYYREELQWLADPQRIFNAIDISPYSPDNSTPALFVPSQAAAVKASQKQFGAQPHQVISYLQDTTKMQSQADWLFSNYGYLHVRVQGMRFDAAPYPLLWKLILGVNVGDVVTAQNWNIGNTGTQWTFRVSNIHRHIEFSGKTGNTSATVTLQLDYEPSSGYWS